MDKECILHRVAMLVFFALVHPVVVETCRRIDHFVWNESDYMRCGKIGDVLKLPRTNVPPPRRRVSPVVDCAKIVRVVHFE